MRQDYPSCPHCRNELRTHPTPETGLWWCPECERECWRDGPAWFSCGSDGEIEKVDV